MSAPHLLHGYTVSSGSTTLLEGPLLGLVSSVQCPGSVIVQLLDAMRAIRAAGITVIGGFHSPVERECLELLLAGTQPIVVVQARPTRRLSTVFRGALESGRMAILAPVAAAPGRLTRRDAAARNEVVVRLSTAILVPYASPGGATERLVHGVLQAGKPVFALADSANGHLVAAGAVAIASGEIPGQALLAYRGRLADRGTVR